jgi:HlyD family secretion protein
MPSHPEKSRATPYILWGSVLVALVLIVVAVRFLTREKVAVRTARVSYEPLIKTSSTNGNVQPIDDFQPHAQGAGVVEDIYVDVGDKVKPGQLLLKMDDADAKARLASAQSALEAARLALSDITHGGTQDERNTFASDLTRAKAQVQQNQAILTAREQLQQKGSASPAEVADARQQLEAAQNNLHSVEQHSTQRYGDADRAGAEAKLADAQAGFAAAKSSYDSVNIHSPLAGTVYAIPVDQYEYVAAGVDLIYVADLNRIQVLAYFDEPEVGNLANGQPVKIVWDAKPDKVWHGHISVAPTSIITYGSTRNVGQASITVDDAHGDLQPNANVVVTVTTAQHPHALSVPREAVQTDSRGSYVLRVINNKLVRTPIQPGIYNLGFEEVLSGLSEGDIVATTATTPRALTDGLDVIPVE